MYISNELKVVNKKEYNEEIRDNFMDILAHVIEKIISQKNIFEMDNFYARYFDEYTLKTNCHENIFNTIYLELNQPLNYKPSKNPKKSLKNKKFKFPELYYKLEDFLSDIYDQFLITLDSNNIVWKEENAVCIKSTIVENDTSFSYYFRVIPCISYYNSQDIRGQMYKKNGGIEIEYVDNAISNFNKKNMETNDLYRQTILIFKNLILKEKNVNILPREIIETMLYNVPNEMYKDDSLPTMINIINYIRNNSIKQFKTIDEQDFALISEYRSMSLIYIKHITKIIEKNLLK